MTKLLGLMVALCTTHGVVLADHEQLEQLSTQLTKQASALYLGARQVIGRWPTWKQRYAFEHISFFHTAAHQFESVLKDSPLSNDHSHDQEIQRRYRRLEHDVHYARQTFGDLFRNRRNSEGETNDHSDDYERLEQLLSDCEDIVHRQIPQHLP